MAVRPCPAGHGLPARAHPEGCRAAVQGRGAEGARKCRGGENCRRRGRWCTERAAESGVSARLARARRHFFGPLFRLVGVPGCRNLPESAGRLVAPPALALGSSFRSELARRRGTSVALSGTPQPAPLPHAARQPDHARRKVSFGRCSAVALARACARAPAREPGLLAPTVTQNEPKCTHFAPLDVPTDVLKCPGSAPRPWPCSAWWTSSSASPCTRAVRTVYTLPVRWPR